MQEIYTYNLFPTTVLTYDLQRKFTQTELDTVNNLIQKENINYNKHNYITFSKNVLDGQNLLNLKEEILQGFIHYMKEIKKSPDSTEIYITQSWINVTEKGQSHHIHSHSNSFLSGVLYIYTDKDDKILFQKPNINYSELNVTPTITTHLNSDTWWVPAVAGQLIVFPSYLEHYVPEVETEHKRISLSMNTFLRGKIGNPDDATFLEL